MMPLPHRITVKRSTPTFNATTGAEVAGGETTIYENVHALISPTSTGAMFGAWGPSEYEENLIFLAAEDSLGNAYVIRQGDRLVNETTNDVWLARVPGETFENPVTFSSGTVKKDHIEIKVQRADLESAGV